MILAIDGPAGCGKSTLAKMISESRNFFYLNSGKMYRAVTWYCIQAGISWSQEEQVLALAKEGNIHWVEEELIFFEKVMGSELHSGSVDSQVSQFSAIAPLRDYINSVIRKTAQNRNLVVEGRDMTTVVFPDADIRIYLDAKPEVRAQRRYEERPGNQDYQGILNALNERDSKDIEKAVGGLKLAPGVTYLDTSYLTIVEVYEKVLSILDEKIRPRSN